LTRAALEAALSLRPPVLPSTLGCSRVSTRHTLPGKGNSNSHGARPVHLIVTMITRIRTSRLSIKNSLSQWRRTCRQASRVEEQLETFEALLPQSQGQNLALTVLYVPSSLDSGFLFTHVFHSFSGVEFARQRAGTGDAAVGSRYIWGRRLAQPGKQPLEALPSDRWRERKQHLTKF